LRLDGDRRAATAQLAQFGIEGVIDEKKLHLSTRRLMRLNKYSSTSTSQIKRRAKSFDHALCIVLRGCRNRGESAGGLHCTSKPTCIRYCRKCGRHFITNHPPSASSRSTVRMGSLAPSPLASF
jgi:hypothetical protein